MKRHTRCASLEGEFSPVRWVSGLLLASVAALVLRVLFPG